MRFERMQEANDDLARRLEDALNNLELALDDLREWRKRAERAESVIGATIEAMDESGLPEAANILRRAIQ